MKTGTVGRIIAALIAVIGVGSFAGAQEISSVNTFDSPFLITAAGQTPDVLMVKIVAERERLDFEYKSLATPADVNQKETLLLVMGVSMKGLGSAGIRLDEEVTRVNELIEAAHSSGIPVIGMFAAGAGGRGGRDQLTDTLLAEIAPRVDYLVVIRSGDRDGFLNGIAVENGIPLTYMETIVDMTRIVPAMFE